MAHATQQGRERRGSDAAAVALRRHHNRIKFTKYGTDRLADRQTDRHQIAALRLLL